MVSEEREHRQHPDFGEGETCRPAKRRSKDKEKIKLTYLLPSIIALVIALTALGAQFSNEIMDLNNTQYTYFINVPDGVDQNDFLLELADTIDDYDASGITMSVSEAGGSKHDDHFELDPSVQIVMMDIPRKTAKQLAQDLSNKYGKKVLFEESVVKYSLVSPSTR